MTASVNGALGDALRQYQSHALGRRRSDGVDAEDVRASGASDVSRAFAGGSPRQAADAVERATAGSESGEADAKAQESFARVDPERRSRDMRKAAEGFSGFFLGFMLKEMRKTVEKSPFGHGDSGERVFQELSDEAYADEAAKSRNNAITDLVYQSLMRGAVVPRNMQ